MTTDALGHVGDHIKIDSWHDVYITNYTKQTQRYTYTYTLSCANMYQNFLRTVDVPPQGSFSDNGHNYGDAKLDSPGTYRISAATRISGAEFTFQDANAILSVLR